MKRLSATQVMMYRRCSLQYFFRYIVGLKMKPVGVMCKGRSVHRGVQVGYQHKAEKGELPPRAQVLQATADEFDQVAPTAKWDPNEVQGAVKDRAVMLTGLHYNSVAPTVDPILVEHRIQYEITPEITMDAYLDVVESSGTIRDTKAVGRRVNKDVISQDLQLASYVIAAESVGLSVDMVALDRLVDTRNARVQQIEMDRNEVETERAMHVTKAVAEGIDRRAFAPCDQLTACGWCGYRKICWGNKWWEFLTDPELARRAAYKVMEDDLTPR